jgi:putative tryptophan/tyrosine transport system substrate-binding protein
MRRRNFIALLAGAAAAWPLAGRAQQRTMPVIGYLGAGYSLAVDMMTALQSGLKEFDYIVDRNVRIEYRFAGTQYERLPALAAELVSRGVSAIAAVGNVNTALAARGATTSIPIVFLIGADPVRNGIVASLDRPGGNVTGVYSLGYETGFTRMELLRELLPQAKVVGALGNPKNPEYSGAPAFVKFAASLGLRLELIRASSESEFEPAIASLAEKQVGALWVGAEVLFVSKRDVLVASLTRHSMPAIFFNKEMVVAGGLMSYGADSADSYRLLGSYVGRVLKGENPANLPIAKPKIDLVINLKTAKAFGLAIPNSLLAKATERIE